MKNIAVFLDRDNTIIEDTGYVDHPDRVRLLPGAAQAVQRFRAMGYKVIVTSNQSGLARGIFDEAALSAVHDRMIELLNTQGAELDDAYYCPYLPGPEARVESYRVDSDQRKPGPGMLLTAARTHDLDLRRCWMIGDSPSDVEAGHRAGCRTILLHHNRADVRSNDPAADYSAGDLVEAARIVEENLRQPLPATQPRNTRRIDELQRSLQNIHELLERSLRRNIHRDFSSLRLFGAILQMFAIAAGLWGAVALLGERYSESTPRFLLACLLQLLSIGAHMADRTR